MSLLAWPGMALLGWLTVRGLFVPIGAHGQAAAAGATHSLVFAFAFAAAFVAGFGAGQSFRTLRRVLRLVFVAGIVHAVIGLAGAAGLFPSTLMGYAFDTQRISGVYTNANRYAVLLSLGFASGMALLGAVLARPLPRWSNRERLRRILYLVWCAAGLLVIAAAIGLSRSRLTILSLALCLGLAALIGVLKEWRARAHEDQALHAGPKAGKTLAAILLPVAAFLTFSLWVSGRGLAERIETLAEQQSPDLNARLRAMSAAWTMFLERPWTGVGLGQFETALRPVQTPELVWRWAQAHNDWFQTAAEAGAPALLGLLACAGAWAWIWWRGLRVRAGRTRFRLLLLGGLGVIVPWLCSAGDFPLREPATAVLYFLLAGALMAAACRSAARPEKGPRPGNGRASRALAFAGMLVCGFVLCAFFAGRAGLAAAQSPWRGMLKLPAPRPGESAAYEAASARDPDSQELLVGYAKALALDVVSNPQRAEAMRPRVEAAAERLEHLLPGDYYAPWLRAAWSYAAGKPDAASELLHEATARAPAYPVLRRQAVRVRLEILSSRGLKGPARDAQLKAVFAQLRALLEQKPDEEDAWVNALLVAGVVPIEVVELWPAGQAGSALRRARFWMETGGWFWARQDLAKADPRSGDPWYPVLKGRLEIEQGQGASGWAAWRKMLDQPYESIAQRRAIETWMARELHWVPAKALAPLAEAVAAEPGPVTEIGLALARRLVDARKPFLADRVLSAVNQRRPTAEGYRIWAELALRMDDPVAALSHARHAVQHSDHGLHWSRWLEEIEVRCRRPAP